MADNGQFEKESAGVNISMSQGIRVLGNSIHGSPRACLNINDGTTWVLEAVLATDPPAVTAS